MCDPFSIIMGGAQTALGIAAEKQKQKAEEARAKAEYNQQLQRVYNQRKYQNDVARYQRERYELAIEYQQELGEWQSERYYENAANIQESLNTQYGAIFNRIEQARTKTLNGIEQAGRAADKGASSITVAASESGTQGNSIRLAKQQFERAEAEYANIEFNNLRNRVNQEKYTMLALRAEAQNKINQLMPAPMSRVDTPGPQPYISILELAVLFLEEFRPGTRWLLCKV